MSELIFDIFLKIFIIGSMVFWWPNMTAYAPQEMFIQYSAIIFFALSLFVPKKRDVSNVYLGLFLIYGIIHTVLGHFEPTCRMALLNVFLGIVIVKVLAERVDFNFVKIARLLLLFCAFNIFEMALQKINRDPIFTSLNYTKMPQPDIVGFMGIRFCLGVLASFAMPFVFSISPWLCLTLLPLLIFSKASTTLVACVASFMFLMWFKNKKAFFISGVFIFSAASYYIFFKDMPGGEFMKRINIWFAGISILKSNPYFGFGLGKWADFQFTTKQLNGEPETWLWAHNEFLQYMFEQGILGAIFLYAYFKNFINKIKFDPTGRVIFASFISLMIISFFHFPFHVGRLCGFSLYILALMEAYTSRSVNEEISFKSIVSDLMHV